MYPKRLDSHPRTLLIVSDRLRVCDYKRIFRDRFFKPSAVFPDSRGRNRSTYGIDQFDDGASTPTGSVLDNTIRKGSQKSRGQMVYRGLICEGQRKRVWVGNSDTTL